MRSLNYVAAALLPIISSAYAGQGYDDGVVVITSTRTVTFCPVIDWLTCDDNVRVTSIPDRDGAPPTTTKTTTTSSGVTTSSTSSGYTTTSTSSGYTTTSTGSGYTTSSTSSGFTTTPWGNGTTTSTNSGDTTSSTSSGITTTTTSNGGSTTTTSFTTSFTTSDTSSSTITTSSTTSGCFNSTRTAAPFAFESGFMNRCNKPGSRDQWCDNKEVTSNTETEYRTGQVRKYRLDIGLGSVDADGMGAIPVFTINGKTPGDPIVANWGDEVEITVTNVMDSASGNATTIHWHGILQHGTNDQDGVPGVTECGIAPGSSRTYKWLASTYGTGWYHGHLLSQYGGGVRGPIIIHGPASSDYDLDMGSIMIDEKFNKGIFNIASFYAGTRGVVVADNYLLNGKNANRNNPNLGEAARWIVKAGKKHLFRIINSSAQSGFVFRIDNHNLTVISADMVPIVPYVTDQLWIHSGQRYNVIVTADQPVAAYDVRALVQQGCGTDIVNSGIYQTNGIMEYEGSCYSVPAKLNVTIANITDCRDELLSNLKPVVTKSAGDSGLFEKDVVNMAGGTNQYLNNTLSNKPGVFVNRWLFGGPTAFTGTATGSATNRINVTYDLPTLQLLPTVGTSDNATQNAATYGNTVFYNSANQWVYWIIQNVEITSHPMHLHGHDFAVLGQAYNKIFTSADIANLNFVNPMRRDTVLLYGKGGVPTSPTRVPGYTVIGFKTDNPGTWLMHCHIIWHADLGMGIQIVERPAEITNYYSKAEFQSECADMKAYEAGDRANRMKAEYESGLKKRHLEEHKFHGYSHGHAIRHE